MTNDELTFEVLRLRKRCNLNARLIARLAKVIEQLSTQVCVDMIQVDDRLDVHRAAIERLGAEDDADWWRRN